MNRRAMNILSTFVLWLSAWMLTWCSLDFSASSSLCVGVVALSEEHVESVEILSDQTAADSECEAMPDQTAAASESEAMPDQTAADSESEAMEDQTAADSENEAMADKAAVDTESEAMEDKAAVDSESERKQEDAVIDSECSVKSGTGTESQNGYIPDPVAKTDLIEPVDKVIPFSSDVPPQKKPKCIVILHQYGVMHPGNYNVDSDGIWQSSSKVTQSGLRQMRALGLWMHDMYGSIIGSSFDSEKMHSMAAQYRSAIDSADSMLRGLFPDTLASFIQHGNSEINLMLMPWTFPSFILHKNRHPLYNMESWKKFYQAYFSSGLNDELDLIQLDRALGTKPLCQTESTLIECLLFAYDMGRYWKSEGLSCPEIICSSENWVRLQKAQQFITHYQFLELRDPFRSNIIPSLGGLVAQGIFETLRKHPEHKFIQLSSHDITLAGLYHALGIIRDGSYEDRQHVSEFGEAIILEIYPDESFRVVRAVPGIASKTAADYSYSGEYLDCKLEGENCSLKNWELIVERNYAPRNVSSIYPCAVLEEEFIYAKCQATQFLDAPFIAKQIHPTQACIEYRKACPAFGCEANKSIASHVVDTSDPSRPCLKVVTDDAINHEPVYPPSDTITSNTPESTTTGRYATSPKLYVAFIVVFVALLFTLSLLVLTWLRPCRSVEHIPLHDHLELRDHDCDASRFNR